MSKEDNLFAQAEQGEKSPEEISESYGEQMDPTQPSLLLIDDISKYTAFLYQIISHCKPGFVPSSRNAFFTGNDESTMNRTQIVNAMQSPGINARGIYAGHPLFISSLVGEIGKRYIPLAILYDWNFRSLFSRRLKKSEYDSFTPVEFLYDLYKLNPYIEPVILTGSDKIAEQNLPWLRNETQLLLPVHNKQDPLDQIAHTVSMAMYRSMSKLLEAKQDLPFSLPEF